MERQPMGEKRVGGACATVAENRAEASDLPIAVVALQFD